MALEIVDRSVLDNTVARFREQNIVLPTFAQLADPSLIPADVQIDLAAVDRNAADPRNLWRVHWYNQAESTDRGAVPLSFEFPRELSGIDARIVVLVGGVFPMIGAHKVLAAYGCLAPRIVTGQFDPTSQRAVWPSTGNYCRGGVAISRIMGCRGVAVLPEGMSRGRFQWLEEWVTDPADIIRTPGTESNVKEIYDKCAELRQLPDHIIFNQFAEFGNYLVHELCTGTAAAHVFESMRSKDSRLELRGFVSATGSAGTIAAGDRLKREFGTQIAAVEALECPTMLNNGFGEHNIQGIGDKHIPLIHNVMNTDYAIAVSDRSTDALDLLFQSETGREYLNGRKGVATQAMDQLGWLGYSGICNVLASIKLAKYLDLGESDVVMTVATDDARLYEEERTTALQGFANGFDPTHAGEIFGEHLAGVGTDNLLDLTHTERERIFNLGYFTWVEQQGVSLEDFVARKSPGYWTQLRESVAEWDAMITDFNQRVASA